VRMDRSVSPTMELILGLGIQERAGSRSGAWIGARAGADCEEGRGATCAESYCGQGGDR
jgi:hypothetical protein